jgi:GH18 family chitinase
MCVRALLLFAATAPLCAAFATIGYLPEWRYSGANFNTLAAHLSHLIFFSAEPLPSGELTGLDRLPSPAVLAEARAAAAATGTKLMVCFGGNGRSSGFSAVARAKPRRARFVARVAALVRGGAYDGVDINWEYPGYAFGSGYKPEGEVEADYAGLAALLRALRRALPAGAPLTLAYYPDGRQEALLLKHGAHRSVDFMHMMTYDANGPAGHSPMSLAEAALAGGVAAGLPAAQLTLGLPFYGRHSVTGDWTTYEDLVQRHAPLAPGVDDVPAAPGSAAGPRISFNGVDMIARKTKMAAEAGWGGVMIWEAGQDCRMRPVTRDGRTHVRTCPGAGSDASLLAAIARALHAVNASDRGRAWLQALDAPHAREADEL